MILGGFWAVWGGLACGRCVVERFYYFLGDFGFWGASGFRVLWCFRRFWVVLNLGFWDCVKCDFVGLVTLGGFVLRV